MAPNQPPWPREWLLTDDRLGAALWPLLERVPIGSGVMLRHDHLADDRRRAMAERIGEVAARRGLVLAVAGDVALARAVGARLVHRPVGDSGDLPVSLPVHDEGEAEAARRRGAALVFVSPVFATRSHPGGATLGTERAAMLARHSGAPAIALGGMSRARFTALATEFHGWAGIDAWIGGESGQNLNAVPT